MSKQFPGGIISKTAPVPSGPYSNDTASGIWTLDQQAYWAKLGQWPNANNPPVDPQFNYVTMLLHGDGTNGAQNNTFLDSSTNNFTITRNGNTTQGSFSPYGSNWSNFFSFNSTAVNYLTSNSLSLSGNFTIEGYVYWDGVGSVPVMFTIGDSQLATGIEIYLSAGNWVVYSNNAGRITGSAGVVGQWTYISVSRTGSTVTMYINGVSQGTWASSQTFSGTIKVGAEFYGGGYSSSMSGYISNFRVNNTTAINTVPTAPLTAVSGTIFLTCQSNRFVDNSANSYAITANGTPSVQRFNPFGASTAYSTSVIGGSGYFDGSGDLLTLADSSAWDYGSGDFTIEFWYYPVSNTTTDIEFIGQWTSGSTDESWSVGHHWTNGLTFFWTTDGSTDQTLSSATILTLNAWNHIAVSKSGTTVSLYLNGARLNTGTLTGSIYNSSRVLDVGGRSQSGANQIQGYLSDVRTVKGTAVYNPTSTTLTVPTAPLTAITNTALLMNFTNGAIFDNAMMNDLETVGNAQISTSVVKYGTGSMYFDGTGDYLFARNNRGSTINGIENFTIEAWIYPTEATNFHAIYCTGHPIQMYIVNNSVSFYASSANSGGYEVNNLQGPSNSISANTWVHVAVVRNGTTFTAYVNGVGGTPQTSSVSIAFPNNESMAIGTYPLSVLSYPWIGYIDDLRITKGYARYTTTFTPPTAAFFNYGPT